ncbi:hypothetical protein Ae201684P_022255 [Aphanomyces euteiches]|uniref:Uncharacterized protein n=1 Tax=Aphanomyces euteiches TaxID=100861 RepID=A0A6G0X695_9STRA|nr:hypothetical protein Ae201684_008088 [Aphanomyces euteiches]KAH9074448.1 hypothetical protein Ae201684P_022255 [Aphanomyces euteiches]
MNILSAAAQSVVYAFTACMEPMKTRLLRAESPESEAPFLELSEDKVPRSPSAGQFSRSIPQDEMKFAMTRDMMQSPEKTGGFQTKHLATISV